MNFTRFRLELAKVTRNKDKEKKIQKKMLSFFIKKEFDNKSKKL